MESGQEHQLCSFQCNTLLEQCQALFEILFFLQHLYQLVMFFSLRKKLILLRNIAKGTTDPRVEFMSQVITQILIKQFQNFHLSINLQTIMTKLKLELLAKPNYIYI